MGSKKICPKTGTSVWIEFILDDLSHSIQEFYWKDTKPNAKFYINIRYPEEIRNETFPSTKM
jgi:hypothetical protein